MRKSVRSPLAWAGLIVGGVALAALAAFLFGLVVMLLWNWLMPELFGLKTLSYWQAWGLVLMSHILFKSIGHGSRREERDQRQQPWKEHFRERFRRHFETGPGAAEPEPPAGSPDAGSAERPA